MGLAQLHLLYVNHISRDTLCIVQFTVCIMHVFIHSFNKYILSVTDVLGIVLGTQDTRPSKRDRDGERDLDNKQLNIQ